MQEPMQQPPQGSPPPMQSGYTPPPGNYSPTPAPASNNKLAAGLCGIFLGWAGVHKFILGYTTEGIILLAVSLLTCGIGATVTSIIGLVEGIIYLTKTDEDFMQTYVVNKKPWF
jgi:TM2 domain-containing membrane protein YozV